MSKYLQAKWLVFSFSCIVETKNLSCCFSTLAHKTNNYRSKTPYKVSSLYNKTFAVTLTDMNTLRGLYYNPYLTTLLKNNSSKTKVKIFQGFNRNSSLVRRKVTFTRLITRKSVLSFKGGKNISTIPNRAPLLKAHELKNTFHVENEFNQAWFYLANPRLRFGFNYQKYDLRLEGLSAFAWRMFRQARSDARSRAWRNKMNINWKKANVLDVIALRGPCIVSPLNYAHWLRYNSLKRARALRQTAYYLKRSAVRIAVMLGVKLKSKQHLVSRKLYNRYVKSSNRLNKKSFLLLSTYLVFNKCYLNNIKKYAHISTTRAGSYFNSLTGYVNRPYYGKVLNNLRHWDYSNLTQRKVFNKWDLLNKRFWSATHNIKLHNNEKLFKVLSTTTFAAPTMKDLEFQKIEFNRLFKWPRWRRPIYYKSLTAENQHKKNFNSSPIRSNIALRNLKFSLKKFKRLYTKGVVLSSVEDSLRQLIKKLTFTSKIDNRWVLKLPYIYAYQPSVLRRVVGNNKCALNINITRKNFFFTLITAKTGAVKKVFSAGYVKEKSTARIRRTLLTFSKVFDLVLKYMNQKNIRQLNFVRIIQNTMAAPNFVLIDKNMNWYPKFFKQQKILVKRWVYELRHIHGLAPRGPKLRRK